MKKTLLLVGVLLSASAYSFNFNPQLPKSYSVKYFHNFGTIDGYVQIPKGGQFGTTSEKRPEFDELGIDNISYPELSLTAKWDKFSMYYALNHKTFKGDATLKKDLITHNTQLYAGEKINTKHKYVFHRFGLGYDFSLAQNLTLTPKFEVSLFDFSYQFSTDAGKNSQRRFRAGTVRVGGAAKYDFSKDFSLTLDLMTHIPHDSIRSSLETSLIASYNVYRQGSTEVNVLAGLSYDMFKYRDTQRDMQNFMYSKTKPIYKLGLELKF
ncbi:transporter [Fusobacterium russii]|uniref:transporter n=1 Tax=Fusobacterium russii TaxID=854 RepID=UPI0003AA1A57|nr:transporter [Fusobacterium russii]